MNSNSPCWNCQTEPPKWQRFCSRCGVRAGGRTPIKDQSVTRGFISRRFRHIKVFLQEQFQSAAAKRLDAIVLSEYPMHDPEGAALEIEDVLMSGSSEPELVSAAKTYLALFYSMAGDERVRSVLSTKFRPNLGFPPDIGPNSNSRVVLQCVTSLIIDGSSNAAKRAFDEALDNAPPLFEDAIASRPDYPRAYAGLGSMYRDLADAILLQCGVSTSVDSSRQGIASKGAENPLLVKHRLATLGVRLSSQIPRPEYLDELVWLYEQSRTQFELAVRLDPTDTLIMKSLAEVSRCLGESRKADESLATALAILNRAIQAHDDDSQIRMERANVLEAMGEIEQAVVDLESALTLAPHQFELTMINDDLQRLRNRK